MSLSIYLNDEIQIPKLKMRAAGVIAKETKRQGQEMALPF